MIVVDSSVWVDYFNGKLTEQTATLHSLLGQEPIVIGDLILAEVLQGFRHDKDVNTARKLFDTLVFREMLGKEMAIRAAQNYRMLRQRGVTVRKTIDIMIATFCIENSLPLLHSDRDFEPMAKHLNLQTMP
jgi:predicted nucleic acid-binding protein